MTDDGYVAGIPDWAKPAVNSLADAGVPMAQLLRAEQSIEYDGMRIGLNGGDNVVDDLKAAADAGIGPAHLYLGELAGQGKIDGGAEQAVSWFERGHELGNAESSARLALHLMLGRGVEEDDPRRADEHVRSLARSAATGGSALASYLYGEFLAKGVGGPMNLQEAESWYVRSAWIGHPLAAKWCREHHGSHQ